MLDLKKAIYGVALAAVLVGPVGAADRLRVVDGDTLARGSVRFRVVNLDAPDIGTHAHCQRERERGQASKRYAVQLVRSGVVTLSPVGRVDRFGRPLVWVSISGQDFAALMIAAGHGRPWRGRSSDWCNGSLSGQ